VRSIAVLSLLALASACRSTRGPGGEGGRGGEDDAAPLAPDERALGRKTVVKAQRAQLALSERWRDDARLTAAYVSPAGEAEQQAEGNVVFLLSGLRLEVEGTLRITWIPDHDEVLLYATDVELFHQERDRPYHSENLSAVTMANDQVSFFQQ